MQLSSPWHGAWCGGISGTRSWRASVSRGVRHEVFGTLWRVRSAERAGHYPISSDDGDGFSDGGQCWCCERLHRAHSCDIGTSLPGQWQVRARADSDDARRCAGFGVHESSAGSEFEGEGICTSSRSEVDHNIENFSERIGYHQHKTFRADVRPRIGFFRWLRAGGLSKSKSKGLPGKEREGKRRIPTCSRGGGGGLDAVHVDRAVGFLGKNMTFRQWAMSLPRRVIASRTEFGRRLLASFSVKWCSRSTTTAALPLPVPFPGCLSGSGPGLSLQRLRNLAQKRVVHTLVVVLNYLFLGRFATFEELGRHPSDLQKKCLQRLSAFVAACGSRPDEFLVPPGRSGPQLVACVDSLERFLEETNLAGFGYDSALKPSASSKKFDERTRTDFPPAF